MANYLMLTCEFQVYLLVPLKQIIHDNLKQAIYSIHGRFLPFLIATGSLQLNQSPVAQTAVSQKWLKVWVDIMHEGLGSEHAVQELVQCCGQA